MARPNRSNDAVLLALGELHEEFGDDIRVSVSTIAGRAGVSESSARRALRNREFYKIRSRKAGSGAQITNRYKLTERAIENLSQLRGGCQNNSDTPNYKAGSGVPTGAPANANEADARTRRHVPSEYAAEWLYFEVEEGVVAAAPTFGYLDGLYSRQAA